MLQYNIDGTRIIDLTIKPFQQKKNFFIFKIDTNIYKYNITITNYYLIFHLILDYRQSKECRYPLILQYRFLFFIFVHYFLSL